MAFSRVKWLVAGAATALIAGATAITAAPVQAAPSSHAAPDSGHAYRHGAVPMLGSASARVAAEPASGGLQPMTYHGDSVVTGPPRVYVVYWGTQWGKATTDASGYTDFSGDRAGMAPRQQAFFKGLGTKGETWSGVMTQYCQGIRVGATTCPVASAHVGHPSSSGVLAGVWYDDSAAAPANATQWQIDREAVSAAVHFGNLSPAAKANVQYVITSPHGTTPDGFNTSGGRFCAWHSSTSRGTDPYDDIAFTNMPYLPDAGRTCGAWWLNTNASGALDGVSLVGGHEYAETLTDPYPIGGWNDDTMSSEGEIGDKCAWMYGPGGMTDLALSTGTFPVQGMWANDANVGPGACETSHPIGSLPRPSVTLSPVATQSTHVGSWVYLRLTAHDSRNPAGLTFTVRGLPPGLVLRGNGVINSRPNRVGSYRVTVWVRDAADATASVTFTWVIRR